MKILIADSFPDSGISALIELGCNVRVEAGLKGSALSDALKREDPDVLVVRSTRVDEEQLRAAANLALVVRAGAGVNTIDVNFASKSGIYVANCPGKNSIAVAELAFAHILGLDRHLVDGAIDLREGRWNKKRYSNADGIFGKCLGLLGLGQIGQEMIERAQAFGMRVIGWSPSLTKKKADALGIEYATTPGDVAAICDILSVHLALTKETRGMIDDSIFAKLRNGAMFINTSRGELVDEAALQKHVQERKIRAGLDVFIDEPSGGEGSVESKLFAIAGIQGSHHIGASTEQAQSAVADETVCIIASFFQSGIVPNCVNLATRTPAKHLLVVRHHDRVGVLAGILDKLRRANINVEEMENKIFLGGDAACARIQVAQLPDDSLLEAFRQQEQVIAVSVTEIR
jgi:D-3-phosphoglycerate dehydrogenase